MGFHAARTATSTFSCRRLARTEQVPTPKQLFAAGWSACFIGAIGIAAAKKRITLPEGTAVDAEVDLGLTKTEYFLQARLNVSLPGLDEENRPRFDRISASDLSLFEGNEREYWRYD